MLPVGLAELEAARLLDLLARLGVGADGLEPGGELGHGLEALTEGGVAYDGAQQPHAGAADAGPGGEVAELLGRRGGARVDLEGVVVLAELLEQLAGEEQRVGVQAGGVVVLGGLHEREGGQAVLDGLPGVVEPVVGLGEVEADVAHPPDLALGQVGEGGLEDGHGLGAAVLLDEGDAHQVAGDGRGDGHAGGVAVDRGLERVLVGAGVVAQAHRELGGLEVELRGDAAARIGPERGDALAGGLQGGLELAGEGELVGQVGVGAGDGPAGLGVLGDPQALAQQRGLGLGVGGEAGAQVGEVAAADERVAALGEGGQFGVEGAGALGELGGDGREVVPGGDVLGSEGEHLAGVEAAVVDALLFAQAVGAVDDPGGAGAGAVRFGLGQVQQREGVGDEGAAGLPGEAVQLGGAGEPGEDLGGVVGLGRLGVGDLGAVLGDELDAERVGDGADAQPGLPGVGRAAVVGGVGGVDGLVEVGALDPLGSEGGGGGLLRLELLEAQVDRLGIGRGVDDAGGGGRVVVVAVAGVELGDDGGPFGLGPVVEFGGGPVAAAGPGHGGVGEAEGLEAPTGEDGDLQEALAVPDAEVEVEEAGVVGEDLDGAGLVAGEGAELDVEGDHRDHVLFALAHHVAAHVVGAGLLGPAEFDQGDEGQGEGVVGLVGAGVLAGQDGVEHLHARVGAVLLGVEDDGGQRGVLACGAVGHVVLLGFAEGLDGGGDAVVVADVEGQLHVVGGGGVHRVAGLGVAAAHLGQPVLDGLQRHVGLLDHLVDDPLERPVQRPGQVGVEVVGAGVEVAQEPGEGDEDARGVAGELVGVDQAVERVVDQFGVADGVGGLHGPLQGRDLRLARLFEAGLVEQSPDRIGVRSRHGQSFVTVQAVSGWVSPVGSGAGRSGVAGLVLTLW